MRLQVQTRRETPADADAVRSINQLAFGSPIEARIVDALRGFADSISLVATAGDFIVGHIFFSPVALEPPAGIRIAGLAPMAVSPAFQRKGVGSHLVRAGLDECRRQGYAAVVVLGHPEFYPRFGFIPAHSRGLKCAFPCAPEVFMALELEAGALTNRRGVIHYRPEFDEA